MIKVLINVLLFPFLCIFGACSKVHYASTNRGKLSGKIVVEWIDKDQFVFRPHPTNPLMFVRGNGDVIQPELMYTDGGSIPRPLWALSSYSPWGMAPAFMVHDWLFEMKHCAKPGHEKYTNHEAAIVMSEVMKTMREDMINAKKTANLPDKFVIWTMYVAVDSSIAKDLWENGQCKPPPFLEGLEAFVQPKATFEIAWPPE